MKIDMEAFMKLHDDDFCDLCITWYCLDGKIK